MNNLPEDHTTEQHKADIDFIAIIVGVVTFGSIGITSFITQWLIKGVTSNGSAEAVVGTLVALTTLFAVKYQLLKNRKAAVVAGMSVLVSYCLVMLGVSLIMGTFVMNLNDLIYMSVPAIAAFMAVKHFETKKPVTAT